MDSENIYAAIRHAVSIAKWVSTDKNEWSSIGATKDFDLEKAQNEVNDFFSESKLYFSVDSETGREIDKSTAAWNIRKHIDKEVFLADTEFNKIMVFSNLGTLKRGSTTE